MRTPEEIQYEVAVLRALVPTGPFAFSTKHKIELAIDELTDREFDQCSIEFEVLPDSDKEIIEAATLWIEGMIEDRPSEGWEGLVE
jgi:hypothetical protein